MTFGLSVRIAGLSVMLGMAFTAMPARAAVIIEQGTVDGSQLQLGGFFFVDLPFTGKPYKITAEFSSGHIVAFDFVRATYTRKYQWVDGLDTWLDDGLRFFSESACYGTGVSGQCSGIGWGGATPVLGSRQVSFVALPISIPAAVVIPGEDIDDPQTIESWSWIFDGEADGEVTYRISVAEVPEPATWALMILGFGLAGGALRKRLHARAVVVEDATAQPAPCLALVGECRLSEGS